MAAIIMKTGLFGSAVQALFCHSFITVISGLGADKVLRLVIRHLWIIYTSSLNTHQTADSGYFL